MSRRLPNRAIALETADNPAGLGITPVGGTLEQFAEFIRADLDKSAALIEARNIKPD